MHDCIALYMKKWIYWWREGRGQSKTHFCQSILACQELREGRKGEGEKLTSGPFCKCIFILTSEILSSACWGMWVHKTLILVMPLNHSNEWRYKWGRLGLLRKSTVYISVGQRLPGRFWRLDPTAKVVKQKSSEKHAAVSVLEPNY